ncbi:MAG TPA: hypothetical protein VMU75_07790 [Acidimicrobiales bacterium]|nr:hypothetical protein [Acidimicrobiales bacterium]
MAATVLDVEVDVDEEVLDGAVLELVGLELELGGEVELEVEPLPPEEEHAASRSPASSAAARVPEDANRRRRNA